MDGVVTSLQSISGRRGTRTAPSGTCRSPTTARWASCAARRSALSPSAWGAEYDKGYEAGLQSFARADRKGDAACIERHRQDLEENCSGYRQDMATLTEENLTSAWNLGVLEGFDAARRK